MPNEMDGYGFRLGKAVEGGVKDSKLWGPAVELVELPSVLEDWDCILVTNVFRFWFQMGEHS